MTSNRLVIVVTLSLILTGCGSSGDEELRLWMADLRATTKPKITPLTEPKQFLPQDIQLNQDLSHLIP